MRIDTQALEEFASLYEQEFGEKITPDQANEMASRLLHLYETLARPLPGEKQFPESSHPAKIS